MTTRSLPSPWRASPAYRVYVIGQTVSGLCGVMAAIAVVYLIVSVSGDSTVPVATATALQFLPLLVFQKTGGRVVDRFSRVLILLVTQSLLAVASAATAIALHLGAGTVPTLIVYSAVLGLVQVVDFAARQVIFSDLLGSEGVRRGIALYNTVFGVGRMAAPALGGLLLATAGPTWLFAINAASFLSMIAGLLVIRRSSKVAPPPSVSRHPDDANASPGGGDAMPWGPLVVVALVGALGYQFATTNTWMTTDVFQQGPTTFGVLSGILAMGGVLGNAVLTRTQRSPTPGSVYLMAATFGVCEVVALTTSSAWTFGALLLPTGFALALFTTSAVTLLQVSVAAGERGRAMTAYNAAYIGFVPVGLLIVGELYSAAGAQSAIAIPGLLIVVTSLSLWLRR